MMAFNLVAFSCCFLGFLVVLNAETVKYVSDMVYFQTGAVIGNVNFEQESDSSTVKICFNLTGLPAGLHGVHVHQYGSIKENCNLAGGHFNPYNNQHGAPTDANRHVGDLGNINVNSDPFVWETTDSVISLLPGDSCIVARVLAIHEKEDDLGTGNNEASKVNGNSGARIACGVIGIAPP